MEDKKVIKYGNTAGVAPGICSPKHIETKKYEALQNKRTTTKINPIEIGDLQKQVDSTRPGSVAQRLKGNGPYFIDAIPINTMNNEKTDRNTSSTSKSDKISTESGFNLELYCRRKITEYFHDESLDVSYSEYLQSKNAIIGGTRINGALIKPIPIDCDYPRLPTSDENDEASSSSQDFNFREYFSRATAKKEGKKVARDLRESSEDTSEFVSSTDSSTDSD